MKFSLSVIFLSLAYLSLAQLPDPRLFSTASSGELVGIKDAHWVVSTSENGPFVPALVVGNCDALWFASPASNANWISFDQGNSCYHNDDLELYFQRSINLPATNDCGRPIGEVFCFEMRFHADNCILEVTVNGVPNYEYLGDFVTCDHLQEEVSVQLCDGWQPGQNQLRVHLRSTPTAVGLLAYAIPPAKVPQDFLGRDTFLCSANVFTIASPDANTRWFDGSIGPSIIVGRSGQYWATRQDAEGCDLRDTVSVVFNSNFYLPSAFSPNDDGINDVFSPFFADLPPSGYLLRVFDRWGALVFESHNPALGWVGDFHGNPCSMGIYAYLVEAGTGDCRKHLSGDVLLFR